jgi:hypothetical protein
MVPLPGTNLWQKKNVEIVMECSTYTIVVPSRKVASAIC